MYIHLLCRLPIIFRIRIYTMIYKLLLYNCNYEYGKLSNKMHTICCPS